MMLKKLKVAAAVATMIASVGGVQAATISQSGGTLAMETIKPVVLPTPQANFTRVRAPAVTYSWSNGPNAQANGSQSFQVVFTLGGDGQPQYAFSAATSGEVPGIIPTPVALMARNAQNTSETITGQLRGAVAASRINVRATDPVAGKFAIVLRSIDIGNTLPGSDPAVHTVIGGANPTTVTYRFDLVNNTGAPIALSDLDLTFNTPKVAGVAADYFQAANQDLDIPTSPNAEFAAITNLQTTGVQPTVGHVANFFNSVACGTDPQPRISIRGDSGINNFQGTEPFTNVPATNVPTFNPSYVIIRRALDVIVSNAGFPNRVIATTNSFAENFSASGLIGNIGLTPTNGIGGTGGGRYTFVPTTKAVLPLQFAPGLDPTVTTTGTATLGSVSSGDERDVSLGGVTFLNRPVSASDRLMSSNYYKFKAPPASGSPSDFSTPGVANDDGGVDINSPGVALQMVVNQTGALAVGSSLRLIDLASMPVGQQTCALSGNAGFGIVPVPTGNPNQFFWNASHGNLQTAADPQGLGGAFLTLAGKTLTLCYRVPGNTNVPAATFTGIVATLFKDDITEQANVSCPGDLAQLYGGVKIDVRNFNLQAATDPAAGWTGILRIVNNSETDTAQVDAQYIWNNGTYGLYGTIIPSLPPRGAVYVNANQVVAALTKPASTLPLNATPAGTVAPSRYDDVPTKALLAAREAGVGTNGAGSIRVRVSADVSTLRVQNYLFNNTAQALTEVSSSQGADFANIESSNRDHIDQDAQTDIKK